MGGRGPECRERGLTDSAEDSEGPSGPAWCLQDLPQGHLGLQFKMWLHTLVKMQTKDPWPLGSALDPQVFGLEVVTEPLCPAPVGQGKSYGLVLLLG